MSRRNGEEVMSTIRFARIFSDKAILQRGRDIRIWGYAACSDTVSVSLAGTTRTSVCDTDGRFDVTFAAMDKGGPYTLEAVSGDGCTVRSEDIMIGDVVLISGQSNMEFPMEMVRESYPDEWEGCEDPLFRTFKVEERAVFGGVLSDVETGEWKSLSEDTIDAFSAVGYFTAKHLRMNEDVAVGLVDITLGGAPIEAFMSEDMLEGYDDALSEARKFSDDVYRQKVLDDNEKNAAEWQESLYSNDIGVRDRYEDGEKILKEGRQIVFPEFFTDTELAGFIGSIWIARRFSVPDEYVGKKARLWFGTIVDFDHCYVNGTLIGSTDLTYPSRRYDIPEGLIRAGENTIVLRIGVERGYGRITPGKIYGIVYGDGVRTTDGFNERLEGCDHIEYLGGVWNYLEGNRCAPPPETVFVSWKPTALWNGMLGPLAGFAVRAFAFYQGESNCQNHEDYPELTRRFIDSMRRLWGYDLPYICVQLPEFCARMEEISYDGGKAWRGLMAAQAKCTGIPGFFLVRSYGTGELNDLHPQRKEPVGKMIAEVIRKAD